MSRLFKIVLLTGVICFAGFVGILAMHHVPSDLTAEDKVYIDKILTNTQIAPDNVRYSSTFKEQIDSILAVQKAAFDTSPTQAKIPLNHTREPKDLYEFDHAQCSDRARFLEKAFQMLGYQVRYAAIFEVPPSHNEFTAALINARSHALVEVKTAKGWIMVDTVNKWIGLDTDSQPWSLAQWKQRKDKKSVQWHETVKDEIYFLMLEDFIYFYGLYSRNGRFYPPYTPYIPDYNLSGLLQNFE